MPTAWPHAPLILRSQAKFQTAYGERANTAIAFAMNADFARVLQDRMDFCNENPNADAFGKVKNQIEDVKGVMVENIEKVRRPDSPSSCS